MQKDRYSKQNLITANRKGSDQTAWMSSWSVTDVCIWVFLDQSHVPDLGYYTSSADPGSDAPNVAYDQWHMIRVCTVC